MEKKEYEKPETLVFELQQHDQLLQTSNNPNASMNVQYYEEDI